MMSKFDQDKEKSGKNLKSHNFKFFPDESKQAVISKKSTCTIPKLQEQ